MFRRLALALIFSAGSLFGSPVFAADLRISIIDESSLPYDFSPLNYNNSPDNYENAISNYDNAPSNYDNSESNYDNTASNYDNGLSGNRRLLYKDGSSWKFAGYYVRGRNGTTNFYSLTGKRMFYNPKEGHAVFNGKDGSFCGVLTKVGEYFSLALTKHGVKTLILSR